jgi:hypothetical protein
MIKKRIGWVPRCIKSKDHEEIGLWIQDIKIRSMDKNQAMREQNFLNIAEPEMEREFQMLPVFVEVPE